IFAAGEAGFVDTYIIAPSTIYGKGRGPCRNIWNNVHVEDLMDLYGLVLELGLSGNGPSDSYERFFFGSAGEHVWGNVAQELAKIMHQKGLVDSAEVKSIALEEEKSLVATATNSRSVANRGFALGWKPSRLSLMETLPLEVEWTIEQMKDGSREPNAPIPYGMEDK
ncbi:hypothetical protein FRC00_012892, partial [Tulasnella sp. 408]